MFKWLRKPEVQEWALNVNHGLTFGEDEGSLIPYEESVRKPPMARTRRSMLIYVETRNAARLRRLRNDYAWLKRTVAEMGLDPEDAKFLL